MANDDQSRLEDLERRLQALERAEGSGPAGTSGGGTTETPGGDSTETSGGATTGPEASAQDAAAIQAFFTGALIASAVAKGATPGQAGQDQGAGTAWASIFGCSSGGWNPTRYDSFFWCKSRFVCNPQSLSCLC